MWFISVFINSFIRNKIVLEVFLSVQSRYFCSSFVGKVNFSYFLSFPSSFSPYYFLIRVQIVPVSIHIVKGISSRQAEFFFFLTSSKGVGNLYSTGTLNEVGSLTSYLL